MFLYLFPVYTINKSGLKKFGFEYQGTIEVFFFYIRRSKGPSQVISYKTNKKSLKVKDSGPLLKC